MRWLSSTPAKKLIMDGIMGSVLAGDNNRAADEQHLIHNTNNTMTHDARLESNLPGSDFGSRVLVCCSLGNWQT